MQKSNPVPLEILCIKKDKNRNTKQVKETLATHYKEWVRQALKYQRRPMEQKKGKKLNGKKSASNKGNEKPVEDLEKSVEENAEKGEKENKENSARKEDLSEEIDSDERSEGDNDANQ